MFLLLAAWTMSNAPFSGPDEASHYLRAMSISNGQLVGPRVQYVHTPGLTPTQLAFVNHDTTSVRVPARLSPSDVSCLNGHADLKGSCLERSPVGDYYPLAYFLPALTIGASHGASTAMWLSRLASALPCALFILVAIALLWSGTAISLLGPLAAITPMALFVCSVINPSGLEIASSLACAAAVLRITRSPSEVPGWTWAAFTVAGVVAILAWQAGPGFVAADLVLGAALLGRAGLRKLVRHSRRVLVGAGVAMLAALALWALYSSASGVSHSSFGISPLITNLHAGLDQLRPVLRDAVGNFASLTVQLPYVPRILWLLLVAGILVVGAWLGGWRARLVILGVTLAGLLWPVLSYAWIYRFSGFGMQGRQVLPALMLIPLVGGELISRRFSQRRLSRGAWLVAVPVAFIALFQAYAWWYNAKAAAGAAQFILFYAHATWSPPLGWWPWIILAALGSLSLLAFAAWEPLRGFRLRPVRSG